MAPPSFEPKFYPVSFFIALILHHIAGGALGLIGASLASHFGIRGAERLPGESALPQCLFCLRPLEWHEAFPLFGWLLRKDALTLPCPCGQKKNLWLQPTIEIIGFVLGVLAVAMNGWEASLIPLCLGLGILPAIAAIDVAFGIIPDMLNIALGILGLIWLASSSNDVFLGLVGSAGLLAFGLLMALGYSRWRGREMLGLGDVKFFAAAGLWLPVILVPWFLAVAGFIGAAFGLYWRKIGGGKEAPFAPALCFALAACIYFALLFPL